MIGTSVWLHSANDVMCCMGQIQNSTATRTSPACPVVHDFQWVKIKYLTIRVLFHTSSTDCIRHSHAAEPKLSISTSKTTNASNNNQWLTITTWYVFLLDHNCCSSKRRTIRSMPVSSSIGLYEFLLYEFLL